MKKDELRTILQRDRLNLSPKEVASKSAIITDLALGGIDWSGIHSLHIYSSVDEWGEVDTKDLIRQISSRWPFIKIIQPQLSRDNPLPSEKFDVIIVPVLGFDKAGNRLGLGGGWYDKFLITQPKALKVGLAYQAGLIENGLPAEPHDISLDKIITEDGIINNHAD